MAQTQSWKLHTPVALVGLMGCGKSVIGKKLASTLGVPFFDLDREIELRQGQSVSEIFAEKGEAYFRVQEETVLLALLEKGVCVIATGGGAFINPAIRQALKNSATTLWLEAGLEVLLARVSGKNTRPLLEKGDKRAILKALMDSRYPVYQQADITIQTTNIPRTVMVQRVLEALKNRHIVSQGE